MPQYPQTKQGSPSTSQALQYELYNNVVSKFSTNSEVQIIREKSAVAAELILDNSLDWVYIDGDHTYNGVSKDFMNYSPFVKSNGLIVFDDYTVNYPGIVEFIDTQIKTNPNYEVIGSYHLGKT